MTSVIGCAQVNSDGTLPATDVQQAFANFVPSRISAGRYLITMPVAIPEGALQVFVTQGDSGGRNHAVVSVISPTTFEVSMSVRGGAAEDPPVATDCSFNLLIMANNGVSFDDAFDVAGVGNVADDGTQPTGSAPPGWVPTAPTTSYPLTCSGDLQARSFSAILLATVKAGAVSQFALRTSVAAGSLVLLRVFPYNAASPATTIVATAFGFVVIRCWKKNG